MTDYNALPAHSAWAYTEGADMKCRENAETYKSLREVCKFGYEPDGDKVVVMGLDSTFYRYRYCVVIIPIGLVALHLALFCDSGNLCFGYGSSGEQIDVYTD